MGVDFPAARGFAVDDRKSGRGNPDDRVLYVVVAKLNFSSSAATDKIDGRDVAWILDGDSRVGGAKDGHYPSSFSRCIRSSIFFASWRSSSGTGIPSFVQSFTTSS